MHHLNGIRTIPREIHRRVSDNNQTRYMQDLTALEGKTIVELREIAKILGIAPSNMKKGELINKIVEATTSESPAPANKPAEEAPKRGRRPRMNSIKVGASPQPRTEVIEDVKTTEEQTQPATENTTEATAEVKEYAPAPKRRGRKPKRAHKQEAATSQPEAEAEVTVVEAANEESEALPIEHISLQDIIAEDNDDDTIDGDELFGDDVDGDDTHADITKDDFTAIIEGEGVLEVMPDGYAFVRQTTTT